MIAVKKIQLDPYTMTSMNLITLKKILKNQFSLMHSNISSFQYHFDELSDLLNESNIKFSVIGLSESRIKMGKHPQLNINLQDYKIEHTPKGWIFVIYLHSIKL